MKKMMSYQESKAFMKDKGITSMEDYLKWYDKNEEEYKKIGLPRRPDIYYSGINDDVLQTMCELYLNSNNKIVDGIQLLDETSADGIFRIGLMYKFLEYYVVFETFNNPIKLLIEDEIVLVTKDYKEAANCYMNISHEILSEYE